MSVRAGCGLSLSPDPARGATQAALAARRQLGDRPADLVFVFCSGAHLADPAVTLEAVYEALDPGALSGCGAGGVLGADREIEEGTAVSVWAADLGDGEAEAFHVTVEQQEDAVAVTGFPGLEGASALVLLPDPYYLSDRPRPGRAPRRRARRSRPRRAGQRSGRRRRGAL